MLLIPHGRPARGRTGVVGNGVVVDDAVGGGVVDGAVVEAAVVGDTASAELATGAGAGAGAAALAGAPLEAAGATELAPVTAARWCAVQPESTNATAASTTRRRTLWSAITSAALRVAVVLGCAVGPR